MLWLHLFYMILQSSARVLSQLGCGFISLLGSLNQSAQQLVKSCCGYMLSQSLCPAVSQVML